MAYTSEGYSLKDIYAVYQIPEVTLYTWIEQFEKEGWGGLEVAKKRKSYSNQVKERAVKDYLSGEYSQYELVRRYNISSRSVLRKWIEKYNGHREGNQTEKGRTLSMTKGRKTTWDERIQIVLDCLENGKTYQRTADIYKVSYQQVYQWVKKYEQDGAEALKDKRGRTKPEAEQSPEEKIRLEMKKVERENERLRAEILFLKKLKEIERRRN